MTYGKRKTINKRRGKEQRPNKRNKYEIHTGSGNSNKKDFKNIKIENQ